MKLYYNPLSSYSQKALIAFYEKGVPFQPELVNLMTPEGRASYQAVFPLGKIPLLKPTEDWMVPESTPIIEYLDDKFPETPRLIPTAGSDLARQVRLMDRTMDLYLNDPVADLLFQKFGFRPVNEQGAARARHFIDVSYGYLEKRLSGGREWLGDTFSLADCAAIPPLFYAQFVAPFEDRPAIKQYWERAQKRASYAKVMKEFVPIWEGLTAQAAA